MTRQAVNKIVECRVSKCAYFGKGMHAGTNNKLNHLCMAEIQLLNTSLKLRSCLCSHGSYTPTGQLNINIVDVDFLATSIVHVMFSHATFSGSL